MKNKLWKICVAAGVLMIGGALFLCLRNIRESRAAGAYAENILVSLKEQIPAYTEPQSAVTEAVQGEENLFAPYETQETEPVMQPAEIVVDGQAYCGFISVPSVQIELPVLSSWSDAGLKTAPCRYSGTAETGDLVIAGHNYRSHFGPLRSLKTGETVLFTDITGRTYRYTVIDKEELDGGDAAGMTGGAEEQWNLTLFTCTLSGKSRITVRAKLSVG